MPRFLGRENVAGVPANALWLTNTIVQVFLIISMFSDYAFMLAVAMTSSMILIPYLLVAAFGVKTNLRGDSAVTLPKGSGAETVQSLVALIYTAGLVYAAGLKFLLLTTLIYIPGTVLFLMARNEQKLIIFNHVELFIFSVLALGFFSVILAITNGILII